MALADFADHESPSPEALADISYGDERLAAETGQGQMIISSKTESATGKERESVNTFSFDKVSLSVRGSCFRADGADLPTCCWAEGGL